MTEPVLYTIGHSTRSAEEFIMMLKSFSIETLADVRHYPGSRKFPHFNQDQLKLVLREASIGYIHFEALGGRRKPSPESINTAWKNAAFRGYADYMLGPEFIAAVEELKGEALRARTAIMCSEAVWWRCHRSLIADHLKASGWTVMHIMNIGKVTGHPYTSPARIGEGGLTYGSES